MAGSIKFHGAMQNVGLSTVITDNLATAIDIETTAGEDMIQVNTADGGERVLIMPTAGAGGMGMARFGIGVASASMGSNNLYLKSSATSCIFALNNDAKQYRMEIIDADDHGTDDADYNDDLLFSDDNGVRFGIRSTGQLITGTISTYTGSGNVAIGDATTLSSVGNNIVAHNVAIGSDALKNLSGTGSAGSVDNVAIGQDAMESATTAYGNVCIGKDAGQGLTTSNNNIFIGRNAGFSTDTGSNNICLGEQAGYSIGSSTHNNTLVGGSECGKLLTAGQCVFLGANIAPAQTSGARTIAIGYQAAANVAGGSANSNTSLGANNIYIGALTRTSRAGALTSPAVAAVTNSVTIGYNATERGSNSVVLGPTTNLSTFFYGSVRAKNVGTTQLSGSMDPTASTTVTGVNTLFLDELAVGDRITVSSETRTVTAIASNTSLTVDVATTDTANDTTPDKLPAHLVLYDSSGNADFIINDEGRVSTSIGPLKVGSAAPSTTALALEVYATAPGNEYLAVLQQGTSANGGRGLKVVNYGTGADDYTIECLSASNGVGLLVGINSNGAGTEILKCAGTTSSAYDTSCFEVFGGGRISMDSLPTSDSGLSAGMIYADGSGDGATLKIKK